MQAAVIGAVADTYVLAGSGALFTALIELALELHASKQMCLDLIENVRGIHPSVQKIVENPHVQEKAALIKYVALLEDIRDFLLTHTRRNFVGRMAGHWKMKERVQTFYTQLELVRELATMDDRLEAAGRFSRVQSSIKRTQMLTEQTKAAIAEDMVTVKQAVTALPNDFVNKLREEGIGLLDMADLKKELKSNSDAYSETQAKTLAKLLGKTSESLKVEVPHIAGWYLSRSDISYKGQSPFASNANSAMYHGTIFSGAKVVVKVVKASPKDKEVVDRFNKEVSMWYELRDPHVLPLYGANNTGSPLLFVMARAELGNFKDYLKTDKTRVWDLFLDAARGLSYLHKKKRVHGNLKCANLLVLASGTGVISDFGFAFVRENSALSAKVQPSSHNWKAPECFDEVNPNPRFESDVYSLGMCLFEAYAGAVPYEDDDEDDAIRKIESGELPTLPQGAHIPADAWDLINNMCAMDYTERIKLSELIPLLEVFAEAEKYRVRNYEPL